MAGRVGREQRSEPFPLLSSRGEAKWWSLGGWWGSPCGPLPPKWREDGEGDLVFPGCLEEIGEQEERGRGSCLPKGLFRCCLSSPKEEEENLPEEKIVVLTYSILYRTFFSHVHLPLFWLFWDGPVDPGSLMAGREGAEEETGLKVSLRLLARRGMLMPPPPPPLHWRRQPPQMAGKASSPGRQRPPGRTRAGRSGGAETAPPPPMPWAAR